MQEKTKNDTPSDGDYFGPYKVFGLQRVDGSTPSGGEIVKVLFEENSAQIMPMRVYELLVSKQPTDFTTIGIKKINAVLGAVVDIMMEYNLTALEAETTLLKASNIISNMFDKAAFCATNNDVYGDSHIEKWTPGTNFSHYKTMLECDMVVKKYQKNNATTPEATIAALKALAPRLRSGQNQKRIVLILGGTNKGLDMRKLLEILEKYCKCVILLPGTGTDLIKPLISKLKIFGGEVGSMKEAVSIAYKVAHKGDTILLSPAFSSFAIFKNEYDRGEQFNREVKKLK